MTRPIIQTHHIVYSSAEHKQSDVTVRIFKGEHWLLTNLNRRSHISLGFVISLRVWLALHEDEAVKL